MRLLTSLAVAPVLFGLAACAASKAMPMKSAEAPEPGAAGAAPPAPSAMEASPVAAPAVEKKSEAFVAPSGVKAGEWDDNANYRDFRAYIGKNWGQSRIDVSQRRFVVVRDKAGKAVPNCRVTLADSEQHTVELTTTANGRAIAFPRADGLGGAKIFASASCQGENVRTTASLEADDAVIELSLTKPRALPKTKTIDVAFVLDTTGSMSEEIAAVKSTIRKVAQQLETQSLDVRVGLVEYKDRGDAYVTRVFQMSGDLGELGRRIDAVRASGGGDTPESMNEGLSVALSQLSWSSTSLARVAFVIADAPPHLDYDNDVDYSVSLERAQKNGIHLYTVAASGMDELGQAVFRQVAQYTGGTNMFVLRGGAGPQSIGGGDPKSSCGGTHQSFSSGNLDELITKKIRKELASLDADPLRIAGLGQDENAKPCAERLTIAD